MDHLMTAEDSYAERRQLFKNIWETAMNIEDKDADIMNKPKVIKTLRLDEVDRYGVNKKKKLKLKNLRTVCNKILDFCDRQEADDMYYEQMNAQAQDIAETQPKKLKNARTKKKIRTAKSLNSPHKSIVPQTTTSERHEEFSAELTKKTSQNTSPIKIKQSTSRKSGTTKSFKQRASVSAAPQNAGKRSTKRNINPQHFRTSGSTKYKYYSYLVDIKPGARSSCSPKKLLQVHKVNIK